MADFSFLNFFVCFNLQTSLLMMHSTHCFFIIQHASFLSGTDTTPSVQTTLSDPAWHTTTIRAFLQHLAISLIGTFVHVLFVNMAFFNIWCVGTPVHAAGDDGEEHSVKNILWNIIWFHQAPKKLSLGFLGGGGGYVYIDFLSSTELWTYDFQKICHCKRHIVDLIMDGPFHWIIQCVCVEHRIHHVL